MAPQKKAQAKKKAQPKPSTPLGYRRMYKGVNTGPASKKKIAARKSVKKKVPVKAVKGVAVKKAPRKREMLRTRVMKKK